MVPAAGPGEGGHRGSRRDLVRARHRGPHAGVHRACTSPPSSRRRPRTRSTTATCSRPRWGTADGSTPTRPPTEAGNWQVHGARGLLAHRTRLPGAPRVQPLGAPRPKLDRSPTPNVTCTPTAATGSARRTTTSGWRDMVSSLQLVAAVEGARSERREELRERRHAACCAGPRRIMTPERPQPRGGRLRVRRAGRATSCVTGLAPPRDPVLLHRGPRGPRRASASRVRRSSEDSGFVGHPLGLGNGRPVVPPELRSLGRGAQPRGGPGLPALGRRRRPSP